MPKITCAFMVESVLKDLNEPTRSQVVDIVKCIARLFEGKLYPPPTNDWSSRQSRLAC